MRVLFYGYEYPPLGGGVATGIKNLFYYFSKENDLQIDFITSSLKDKYEVVKKYDNITFYKIPIGRKSQESYHKQIPMNMVLYTLRSCFLT